MQCIDWHEAGRDTLRTIYDAERWRWAASLSWDLAPVLARIEASRALGRLPGWIACDDRGAAVGWTCYTFGGGVLQIGALVARDDAVAGALTDRVLATPEAQTATTIWGFLLPECAAVERVFADRTFGIRRQLYLERSLDGVPAPTPTAITLEPWDRSAQAACIRLLARCYAGQPHARMFAPHGRLDEWSEYFEQLVTGAACGRLLEEASVIAVDEGRPGPVGFALVTTIAPDTAHLVQVGVDPFMRRRGIARALVQAAAGRARALGYRRLTLIVSEDNADALGLYARLHFRGAPRFLLVERRADATRRSSNS